MSADNSFQFKRARSRNNYMRSMCAVAVVAGALSLGYWKLSTNEHIQRSAERSGGLDSKTAASENSVGTSTIESHSASQETVPASPRSSEAGSSAEGSTPDQGSATTSINWESVLDSYPIPREMPARESDLPYEAGFAAEWVERSLRNRRAFYYRYAGSPLIDPKPLILDILSAPKRPEDNWAYGAEHEIRRVVDREFHGIQPPDVERIFCNIHGCLIYFEFQGRVASKLGIVPNAILRAEWSEDFGIRKQNIFEIVGRRDDVGIRWQLFLIHRHPPVSAR